MTEDKKDIRAQFDQSDVEGSRSGQSLKSVDLIWITFLLAAVGSFFFAERGVGTFLLLLFCVSAVVSTRFVARHLRGKGSYRRGRDEVTKRPLLLPQWLSGSLPATSDYLAFVAALCLLMSYPLLGSATPQNDNTLINGSCFWVFVVAYCKSQGSRWREHSALMKFALVIFWCGVFLWGITDEDIHNKF